MRKRTRFIYNTALLTASTLLMRAIGCAFQVWLAGRIGSAGIGLYQLMGSVGGLAVTFAVSGIGFGTMRLVSEELGAGRPRSAGKAVLCCLGYALFFGCLSGLLLYRFAEPIGFLWIEDGRTVLPLRIMAWELPFIALSAVFSGYFTACGRVGRSTAAALSQQLLTIGLTYALLQAVPHGDIAQNCACITLAGTLSEAAGCCALGLLYVIDRLTHDRSGASARGLVPRLLGISLPLAVSAYTRSALSTLQHMLTPSGLRKSGLTAAQALSAYGIVHGMTLTVIYFPTCILYVVAQLLIPDLTEAQVQGSCGRINRICTKMLRLSLAYSALTAAGLFLLADTLAMGIYSTPQVADYIRIFAPLVPMIYTDIIVDGCLKGLGLQLWSMGINILESAVSVVLTYVLIPRFGIMGFVGVVYFNEVFNFVLSFWKLRQVMHCNPTETAV
ncbi:MAG: polysaccharide biosynthesis C-terminal domain-containing protein [Oscillospiraceae bacterium]|nr:polysaccharide biosynthesis C-terminal domain-containing protein [Oscillospiraceae bacterium]